MTIGVFFTALLLPTAGAARGFDAIARHARFRKKPLQRAARAGALCMVVRTESWEIRDNEVVDHAIVRGPLVKARGVKLSGKCFNGTGAGIWMPDTIFKRDAESTEEVMSGSGSHCA